MSRSDGTFRLAMVVMAVVGIAWMGVRSFRCWRRGEAFSRQVQSIRADANQQLKIETKREDVARFFEQHSVPFVTYENMAEGGLSTTGCAPFGCGADRAMLRVQVKLDAAGAVTEEPRVFGMYLDCL